VGSIRVSHIRFWGVSAGQPGLIRSGAFQEGTVVVDAGYANPGGVGDLDPSDGLTHLGAIVPVPGGLGPMTVSMMVEEVIARAEVEASGP